MRHLKNVVKIFFVIACAIICARTAQADEKALSPEQAIKLFGGQTLITLHLKDATPLEFYTELWRQASLPPLNTKQMTFWRDRPLISISVKNKPFWSVVQRVAVDYGISVGTIEEGRIEPWQATGETVGAFVSNGPFLFTINNISHSTLRSMNVYPDKKQLMVDNRLLLGINIYTDPKLPLLREGTTITVTQAVNDKGVSLLAQSPLQDKVNTYEKFTSHVRIPLMPQSIDGGMITKLKGSIRTVIATKSAMWEINDLANVGDAERGVKPKLLVSSMPLNDVAYYTLKEVKTIDRGYSFDLTFLRSHTLLDTWAMGLAMFADVTVLDDKGIELTRMGGSSTYGFDASDPLNEKLQRGTSHYKFLRTDKNSPEGPVKLIWKYPVEFRTVEVPFEFTNLPLP